MKPLKWRQEKDSIGNPLPREHNLRQSALHTRTCNPDQVPLQRWATATEKTQMPTSFEEPCVKVIELNPSENCLLPPGR